MGVLITGAGRGIGKRLALGFAKAGARVGLLGRNQAELDVTRLEIEDAGGVSIGLRADVTNPDAVAGAVGRMTTEWGAVDALIANAGVQGPIGPFCKTRPHEWQEVFNVDLFGVLNCAHAVLPQMVKRRRGKIIAVSCTGAAEPRPGFAIYAAAKASVARFVECLAEEVRESNVQVNSMLPGDAYTTMTDEVLHAAARIDAAEFDAAHHVRMTGGVPPEKQLQLALFLASERSNHVTGKLIHVLDDWKRLEKENGRADAFTLRRHK